MASLEVILKNGILKFDITDYIYTKIYIMFVYDHQSKLKNGSCLHTNPRDGFYVCDSGKACIIYPTWKNSHIKVGYYIIGYRTHSVCDGKISKVELS